MSFSFICFGSASIYCIIYHYFHMFTSIIPFTSYRTRKVIYMFFIRFGGGGVDFQNVLVKVLLLYKYLIAHFGPTYLFNQMYNTVWVRLLLYYIKYTTKIILTYNFIFTTFPLLLQIRAYLFRSLL